MKKKILFALLVVTAFFGVRLLFSSPIQEAGIENATQHQKNKAIFNSVIEKALQRYPTAETLLLHMGEIGEEARKNGLVLSAYSYVTHPDTGELCFTAIPIWEGGERIPVTFFLYIWPSIGEALKTEKAIDNSYYASNMHSHPIPCAFTLLQGSITEYCYLQDKTHPLSPVREVGKKKFYIGEGDVDLNASPFIHQMVFEGEGKKPAITCHAYGKPTASQVMETFRRTHNEHVYLHLLSPDGQIVTRPW